MTITPIPEAMINRFKTTPAALSWLLSAWLLLPSYSASSAEIRVAVASNFAATMRTISARFEQQSDHRVTLIIGSTGKHYAQIHNGAPFDLFFAADSRRPQLLESDGSAVAGSRFTYAIGRLVLWSPTVGLVEDGGQVLENGNFRYLAIANPRLAPYGKAARQLLLQRQLWDKLQHRLVQGENIGQALQFVRSGNAELGLVAWSQLRRPGVPIAGSYWLVPQSLHAPIEQQAVLLTDHPAARDFLAFVKGPQALAVINDFGYASAP